MTVVRVCGLIVGIIAVAVVAARVSAQGPGVMTVDEIRLVDKTGALRAHLLIGTNNATVLNLNGPDGYPRLSLAVDTAGTPSVRFMDRRGEVTWVKRGRASDRLGPHFSPIPLIAPGRDGLREQTARPLADRVGDMTERLDDVISRVNALSDLAAD
jgi:hypothetical protein